MKKVTRGIEYAAVRILAAFLNSLPEHSALSMGSRLGELVSALMRRRARIIHENLRLCGVVFESPFRRKLFTVRCFQHFGVAAAEIVRERIYRDDDILRKITYSDEAALKSLSASGTGAILMSGHFGNWELLGAYVRCLGHPIDLLVKRQSNTKVDEWLNETRRSRGVGVIFTDSGARDLIASIRKGKFVAILADQYGGAESEPTPFFGIEAMVPTGPAVLIQRYNIPMVWGVLRRAKNGREFLRTQVFTQISELERSEIVGTYTRLLESEIRQHPEQWLWTHRRFKNLTDYSRQK